MEDILPPEDSVQDILNFQREESEAREIVKDIGNLHSVPTDKKGRWVWELLQNARDCAQLVSPARKSVNVEIFLQSDRLIFRHNGKPFPIPDLIALFRRTSTKGVTGQEGATGKYGTGFITTHVLSKIVYVDGYVRDRRGLKHFRLEMNRSFEEIPDMQKELEKVFGKITEIQNSQEYVSPEETWTQFEFPLNEKSRGIAVQTIQELLSNIHFTMLCNQALTSIKVNDSISGSNTSIILEASIPITDKVKYCRTEEQTSKGPEKGIMLYEEENLFLIGLPVEKFNENYSITEIENKARFYKELPLIGTENSNMPFFIQSPCFLPPEPRDGLRIQKDEEDKPDKVADGNREILSKLPERVKAFFVEMQQIGALNLHLLMESGQPYDRFNYVDPSWYADNIQKPLRDFYKTVSIVTTIKGGPKPIAECYFIDFSDALYEVMFYELVAELEPERFPDKFTWKSWNRIIHQDAMKWPENILYGFDNLVNQISGYEKLDNLPFEKLDIAFEWLNKFYALLKDTQRLSVADTKALFPSQAKSLELRPSLKMDTLKNEVLKNITETFGHLVKNRLLHDKIELTEGFESFKLDDFISGFHKTLGGTKIEGLTPEKIVALLKVVSLFRNMKSPARKRIYDIIKDLLGTSLPEIAVVDDMEYYDWETPDFLVVKYACWLVQEAESLEKFTTTYFGGHEISSIKWLNGFYDLLTSTEEYRKMREDYKIYLTQSLKFNRWKDGIQYEATQKPFEPLFKDLYRDYVKQKDQYDFLIDRKIDRLDFPAVDLETITLAIDALFAPKDAENMVVDKGLYNDLFHKINNYVKGQDEEKANRLFPNFMKNQAVLLVKAMGRDISRKVMILQKMNRSEEDLNKMAQLTLPAEQLKILEQAALQIGTDKLLIKVQEMQQASEQAIWRKKVGTKAEEAFHDAIKGVQIELIEIENPDEGCDYTLTLKGSQKEPYLVEIKSTGYEKGTVKMSKVQGEHASTAVDRYSLCVIERDEKDEVSVQDFIIKSKFLPTIGTLVKDKVDLINSGLILIEQQEVGDVSVALENKKYSVNVKEKVWVDDGIDFGNFVILLKAYLGVVTKE